MSPQDKIPGPEQIRAAADRIAPYIHHTPVFTSEMIDSVTGARLFFKCENLQKAGAFKSRGACNTVFSLDDEEVAHGVCTHSSGNHAQALARAAKLRGCPAYIVMPKTASKVKVEAVKHYGGEITFCQPTLESREETLTEVKAKTGATEVHPYNDYRIIAGQATATLELLEVVPSPDIIMAPVGGGGLLSGTALASNYFSSGARVIAGEPAGADDAFRSFTSGRFIPSVNPVTIADGLLTSLGTLTWPIIKDHVTEIITVKEESIIKAMTMVWQYMKLIIEPSSAVPLAVVLENPGKFRETTTVIIFSGGNVDLNKLPWS